MTKSEQHRLIEELRDYARKMTRAEQYDFEMFSKRDKDDEDLDTLARQKLEQLHGKYIVKKTKKDVEALLKKLTTDQKKDENTQ